MSSRSCQVWRMVWKHLIITAMQSLSSCYRDVQHSPGVELPITDILTVSLSPFSVSSWIRSSAHTVSHVVTSHPENSCVRYFSSFPSSCCPCTTFCRNILATSSACAMPAAASSPPASWRFELNPLRASWRAAERSRSSPRQGNFQY